MKIEYIDLHTIGWYGLLLPIKYEIQEWNKKNKNNKINIYTKEKLGYLSISLHADNLPEYLFRMAIEAQRESGNICQLCGKKGKHIKIKHWYWTLCDKHSRAREMAEKEDILDIEYETRIIYSELILNEN